VKMKKKALLAVLFAAGSFMAQSGSGQSSGANKRHSKYSRGEVTVRGCLSITSGDYVLVQTDPGASYELDGRRKIKLGPHLGEQVEVTGWESPSLSTSSDIFNKLGSPSSVTIMVTSIRMIAKECTAREVTANSAVAPVSGAQLHISSTPPGAAIEIDGDFVGDAPSTVGVGQGQHQLVVKKSGYKPWEKKIAVSSGQVKVDAVLEAESK
jgi:hypothetical protein